jgi:glycerophosphoryl diester phosphodiesterase
MPSAPPPHPFLDHPGPIPFAHRGGAEGPHSENTLAAFRHAVDNGYRYLETDVHATNDGILLAFHDRRLGRVTDGRGRIANLPHDAVSAARITPGDQPIPLMADLLEEFPDARFNIDVKEPNAVGPLARLLRDTGSLDRVCVSSFSDKRLAAIRRELGPGLCTAAGPREAYRIWRASRRTTDTAAMPVMEAMCLQLPPRVGRLAVVDERLIAAARLVGLPVHVWTIDDPAEMDRLLDLGVDGLMTDRIDVLKDVLTRRGAWH